MTQPTCPVCGAVIIAGSIFCDSCGVDLRATPPVASSEASAPPAPVVAATFSANALPVFEPPIMSAAAQPAARLVVTGANVVLELPSDRPELVVGREDAISGVFPDINLEPYGAQDAGVSRRHARLADSRGSWTVEDLNTVNGTFLNHQRLPGSQPAALKDGDELRLGNLRMNFYLGE
jgi:hypothetical protein